MPACEYCSYESNHQSVLSRHVKNKHGIILSTLHNTCIHCKKVFSSSSSCSRHVANKICIKKPTILPEETPLVIEEMPEQPPIEIEEFDSVVARDVREEVLSELQSFPIKLEDKKEKQPPFIYTLIKHSYLLIIICPFLYKKYSKW